MDRRQPESSVASRFSPQSEANGVLKCLSQIVDFILQGRLSSGDDFCSMQPSSCVYQSHFKLMHAVFLRLGHTCNIMQPRIVANPLLLKLSPECLKITRNRSIGLCLLFTCHTSRAGKNLHLNFQLNRGEYDFLDS